MTSTNSASAVADGLDRFNPFAPHPFTDPQSRLDAQSDINLTSNNNNKARSSHAPTSYYDLYARAAKAATSPSPSSLSSSSSSSEGYVSLGASAATTPPGTIPLSSAALQQRNYTMTSGSRMSNGGGHGGGVNSGPDLETRRRAQELILRAGSGSPKYDDELPVLRRKRDYVLDGF